MLFFGSIAKSSKLCFVLHHKNQLFSEPILPRLFWNPWQCCIYFSNLAGAAVSRSDENSYSFTINYLVNSCGLSLKKAIRVSKQVQFETPEKPNAVLALLKDQGFSKPHIEKLVATQPRLLLFKPEKTLLPKIEVFRSICVSRTQLASNLSGNSFLLNRSLHRQILPIVNYLKSVFLDDKRIASPVLWRTCFWYKDTTRNIASNINLLRELGVSESNIIYLLTHFGLVLVQENEDFREIVSEVKEMGFYYCKSSFVLALYARSRKSSRSRWNKSHELYRSWGWSENDIRMAFRTHPCCMLFSEKKINITMDFLVNKMGWQSQIIAQTPSIFCYSLKRRIIPRGSVVHLLSSKGLLKKKLSLSSVFAPTNNYFEGRFVTAYEDQLPNLRGVYEGKVAVFDV